MIINHKKKWIYIGPPKTGSTSISYILTDGKYNPNYPSEILKPNFKGIEINGQHTPWPPDQLDSKYDNYNVFISVRNPFSRIVSLYCHWKYGDNYLTESTFKANNLEEFLCLVLKKKLSNNGFFHTTITDWVSKYDFYIKQENLQNDLYLLNIHSNEFKIPIKNEKIDSSIHWKKYHNKKTIDMTIKWAQEDFNNFNYSKDIND